MRYHKTYKCEDCDIVFDHWSKYQKHKKAKHVPSCEYLIQLLKIMYSLIPAFFPEGNQGAKVQYS